jgi:LTXXQ motif family protein
MSHRKICVVLAMILTVAAAPTLAADDQHEQHHPGTPPPAATAPQGMGQGPASGAMRGMPKMGMGRDGDMQGSPMMGMMGQGGMMGGMRMMAGRTEGRIAFLKAELKITDAQLPLWNAVADAIRANAKSGMDMMEGMGMGGKLPDRLAAREKMLSARLAALRAFKSAVDPLYAALSDEQKKTADELLMSPMGMM